MEPSTPPGIAEQLLTQHAWVRRLAREIAGEAEADDLAQDAWLAALEDPPEERSGLRPWLAGVVRHLASGLRRSRGRRVTRERTTARSEALPSTVELVERVDTGQRLARALIELAEPYRTTLLLRFFEELPAAEIARRQGVPEGTVRWRVKHGLAELRTRLTRELGGEEALGIALLDLSHGKRPGAPAPEAGAGAGSAAGGTAMIGAKGIAAAVVVVGTLLGARFVVERREPPRAARAPSVGQIDMELSASKEESGAAREAALEAPASSNPSGSTRLPLTDSTVTRLHVLESDGRPNAELNVVIAPATEEEHAHARLTDANGWVEFPASGERRTVAIERTGAFPHRTEIDLFAGEQTIALPAPRGLPLAGRVVVDGKPPPSTMWLLLFAAQSADGTVNTDDASCLLTHDVTYGATDDYGRFRFLGLAPGQGLNLRAPEGYQRPGRPSNHHDGALFHLEGPDDDLLIELERMPSVRGRVLEADGLTPAAGASVEIVMEGGTWGRSTGPDGRFEIFTSEPPESLVVRYGRFLVAPHGLPGALPGLKAEFHFSEPGKDTDLGDLLLAENAGFLLEVRDPEGRAVEGAETKVSQPTDVYGRARVEGAGPGAELVITHRGYRAAFVTLPDPLPPALPVVLEPTNDLTIEVRGANGEPLPYIEVELAAQDWFFTTPDPWSMSPLDDLPWLGIHEGRHGSVWGGNPTRVRISTSKNGRCSMGELRPGVALHLKVLDDLDLVLHEQELAPLGPTEPRVVHVQLDVVLAHLRGRLLNEHGEPIVGADVAAGPAASGGTRSHSTGNDGRFQFPHITEQGLRITATKRGFLPLVREFSSLPAGELELVLVRGADVIVRVFDAEDRSLVPEAPSVSGTITVNGRRMVFSGSSHGPKVRARPVGATDWISAEALEDGVFELAGLASTPHEIELELEAGILRETWTPPEPEVVFHIADRIGTIELSWNLGSEPNTAGYHVRLEPVGGGAARERHIDVTPRGGMRILQFAGDYELVLVAERPAPDGSRWNDDLSRRPLSVKPGETTKIELP